MRKQTGKRPMQDRQLLKRTVSQQLSGRVFRCFLACLIPAAIPWLMRLFPVRIGVMYVSVSDAVLLGISVPMTLLSYAVAIFATDPMRVRLSGFFLTLVRDPESLPSPLAVTDCFGPGYLRLVGGMLLRSVRVTAWTLLPLLIGALVPGTWDIVSVPEATLATGIVPAYRYLRLNDASSWFFLAALVMNLYWSLVYSMVPYVLFDRPALSAGEALRESRALTRGRVLELVVLELSFLGWVLLTSLTLLLAAVFAYPYIEGTMAAYYLAFIQPMPWEKPPEAPDGGPDATG